MVRSILHTVGFDVHTNWCFVIAVAVAVFFLFAHYLLLNMYVLFLALYNILMFQCQKCTGDFDSVDVH